MSSDHLTRRELLAALAAGSGALALACGGVSLPPGPPTESPFYNGKYDTRRALLGVTPGTAPMPTPASVVRFTTQFTCPNASPDVFATPSAIQVMICYPAGGASDDVSLPVNIWRQPGVTFPLVLFGHAKRQPTCPGGFPAGVDPALYNVHLDYQRVGHLLIEHLVSYGFVVAVPDLTFFAMGGDDGSQRARVLVALYDYLVSLNGSVFANRLDPSRVALLGHSTGAAACLYARTGLVAAGGPQPLALGLIAPAASATALALASAQAPHGLMTFKGTNDTQQTANPDAVYAAAQSPKILVTFVGANHFGYTDICDLENKVCAADDPAGDIPREPLQIGAGAYLAALLRRFVLADTTVTPYLTGQQKITGPFMPLPAQISIQQSGM
jgi:hypothetical protein